MMHVMNRKQLAKILPTVVGIGFCLIEAMKVVFQLHATEAKGEERFA
jgi:hypothetical protein